MEREGALVAGYVDVEVEAQQPTHACGLWSTRAPEE